MKTAIFILIYLLSIPCLSQNGITQLGGRPDGMGHAYATESDTWSLFHNPAGLGNLNELSAAFAYEKGLIGLSKVGAGVISKMPIGSAGISVFKFGDDLYNEQALALAYGNKFGIASLGVKVSLLQYYVEGIGSKSIVALDFGGIANITDQLLFGAYVRNINQAELSEFSDERAPSLLNAGISYRPIDNLHLNIEAEKDLDYPATLRLGMEYILLSKIAMRLGVNTKPFTNYAGLGFNLSKIQLSYSLSKPLTLGYFHQASLILKLKRDKR